MENDSLDDAVEIPIDGTLDLHAFKPSDINSLVPEYLLECRKKGIYSVRIIHGKGSGALRRGVHGILKKQQFVENFQLADETGGSWGATLVRLKKK